MNTIKDYRYGKIDDAILEIKCPPSVKEYTPEVIINNKLKFVIFHNGKLILKRIDYYYFQIQGQLNITKRNFRYFVEWTLKGNTLTQ